MTKTYLVAFDDESGEPWIHKFHAIGYSDLQDKITNYIYEEYELDDIKMPTDFEGFKEKCHTLDIFIGEIKEIEE